MFSELGTRKSEALPRADLGEDGDCRTQSKPELRPDFAFLFGKKLDLS
ncbi:hypothetical protein [Stieleria maiorica]|nr:hypothetical protein [Stieleria maiorica]